MTSCPECSAPLPPPRPSGSPRKFCSSVCRNSFHRRRLERGSNGLTLEEARHVLAERCVETSPQGKIEGNGARRDEGEKNVWLKGIYDAQFLLALGIYLKHHGSPL